MSHCIFLLLRKLTIFNLFLDSILIICLFIITIRIKIIDEVYNLP